MDITLSKAFISDVEELYSLQIASFKQLLEKYQDYDFSPGSEKMERTIQRLHEPNTDYYFICLLKKHIGAIRVCRYDSLCELKQIFIVSEFQGNGYAQEAIRQVESLYPNARRWELDTIEQEVKLCHLYEKMGYVRTGKICKIKEGMNLVDYVKQTAKIIILRGNSGSGKTTAAKKLQRHLGRGTMIISQDVVRREMLYVRDEPENKAINLLINLIEYGNKNCEIVILEGILYSDYYNELFEAIVKTYGNNIFAYYFDIPFEETLIRHNISPNINKFGEVEMKRWWREKDYIKIIHETILNKNMTIDTIVHLIAGQVGK